MNKKIIKEYTLRLFDDGSAQIIPNIRWLDRNDESNNIIIGENISKSLFKKEQTNVSIISRMSYGIRSSCGERSSRIRL